MPRPDDFDDRPRQRRFEDDDDHDRPRRRKSGGGSGLLIGLLIGGGVLVLLCAGLLVGGFFYARSKVQDAAGRMVSSNNLKQLSLAMRNYESANSSLPLPSLTGPGDRNGLSWRAGLLPYVEQESVFRMLNTNERWDSPTNSRAATVAVQTFITPNDPETAPGTGRTRYRVFVGGGAMFEWDKKTKFFGKEDERTAVVTDGLANTIMIAEAAEAVPWPKPQELEYSPNGPLPQLGPPDRDTFLVAMGDGSVRPVKKDIKESTLRALITRGGGEVVPPDF